LCFIFLCRKVSHVWTKSHTMIWITAHLSTLIQFKDELLPSELLVTLCILDNWYFPGYWTTILSLFSTKSLKHVYCIPASFLCEKKLKYPSFARVFLKMNRPEIMKLLFISRLFNELLLNACSYVYIRLIFYKSGVRFPIGAGNFSLPHRTQTALMPTQPPIRWIPCTVSLGVKPPGVKLTTPLHIVPRSRMRGAIYPLPNTSSWRGTQLRKHRHNFTLSYRTCIFNKLHKQC
jgi:hypothetical protein